MINWFIKHAMDVPTKEKDTIFTTWKPALFAKYWIPPLVYLKKSKFSKGCSLYINGIDKTQTPPFFRTRLASNKNDFGFVICSNTSNAQYESKNEFRKGKAVASHEISGRSD